MYDLHMSALSSPLSRRNEIQKERCVNTGVYMSLGNKAYVSNIVAS